jgi:hypothetical protein
MPDAVRVARLLQQGIAAAKAGRKDQARQILIQVTELDERNEQAWLWLSGVVESLEDRRICLENVLAINPGNTAAQAGLRLLDKQKVALPGLSAMEETRSQHRVEQPRQGWGETARDVSGLLLPLGLAAWVNARMAPTQLSVADWLALLAAGVGAYLWVSATDAPNNPGMVALFGEDGVRGTWRQILLGLPGIALWLLAFGLILIKA